MIPPPVVCQNCGKPINPYTILCPHCGVRLRAASSGTSTLRIVWGVLALIAACPLALFGGCVAILSTMDHPGSRPPDWLSTMLLYMVAPLVASVLLVVLAIRLFIRR